MLPQPPEMARTLMFLLDDPSETVCGDLLEEYREVRLTALGRRRANLWYWRQVSGIWFRAYWWLAVPVVAVLVAGDLVSTFQAPPGPGFIPALFSPIAALTLIGFAGAYGSWRTRQWAGGVLAALGTSIVAWLFVAAWSSATFYLFAHVKQSNPYWIQAWQWSTHRAYAKAGITVPRETFVHWMFWDDIGGLFYGGLSMLTAAFVGGGLGSLVGLVAPRRRVATIQRPSN